MSEIAAEVGIKKASLYAHFRGKDDLFLAIYHELIVEFDNIMDQYIEDAKNMDFEDKLYYIFKKYIQYFLNNKKRIDFFYQFMYFKPPSLYDKVESHIYKYQIRFQKKLEQIFEEGIVQGVIKENSLFEMVSAFRCLREGVLLFLILDTGVEEKHIKLIWEIFWTGLQK